MNLLDGRLRTISSKFPPSKTLQVPCDYPPTGEADKAREGPWQFRASILKSDLALVAVQNALVAVQDARFEILCHPLGA
jgi:hypothetical protein